MLARLLIVVLTLCVGGFAAAQTVGHDRYAIDMSEGDPARMRSALTIALSLAREYAVRQQHVEVKVVAHGPGLALLREDVSPALRHLKFIAQSMDTVEFAACAFTANRAARKEGEPPPILSLATRVPVGPKSIEQLAAEGWTIIRP